REDEKAEGNRDSTRQPQEAERDELDAPFPASVPFHRDPFFVFLLNVLGDYQGRRPAHRAGGRVARLLGTACLVDWTGADAAEMSFHDTFNPLLTEDTA